MKTFEDYLKEIHARVYIGSDDAMPHVFEAWLSDIDTEEILGYVEEYRQSIITLIENEPTDFPVRESDEFDAGGRAFKQALLSKLI